MKKILFLSLFLAAKIACGQTVQVNGTVTDERGKPVPFAFISDSQHPYATFSDPNGGFGLQADPASMLIVTANYHSETRVKIDKADNVKIIMTGGVVSQAAGAKASTDNFFIPDETRIEHLSLNAIGSGQSGLHGSKYLFDNWVHGFAVTPRDSIKQNDVYLFNYDKLAGNLIFTRNKTTALLVIKSEIKGFTLFDDNALPYVFEEVTAIDPRHYLQVLAAGNKYKIYKNLGTVFIKANFVTNGITSSGNNYDEYKDESTYYVVKSGGQPQKFELKSKAIKTAFAAEPDKIKKYLSDNEGDMDENYLIALGEFMNK